MAFTGPPDGTRIARPQRCGRLCRGLGAGVRGAGDDGMAYLSASSGERSGGRCSIHRAYRWEEEVRMPCWRRWIAYP